MLPPEVGQPNDFFTQVQLKFIAVCHDEVLSSMVKFYGKAFGLIYGIFFLKKKK